MLPDWFEVYIDLEAEAETLSVYDHQFVNGLLQTEDYARALLTASRPEDRPEEIDWRVELHMARQAKVSNGKLRLHTIIEECVLHRTYGTQAVMSAQIDRMVQIARLSNVCVQVLPARSPVGVLGSFTLLEFTVADPSGVYLENEIGALYLEKPEQIRHYSRLYDRLRAVALSPEASVAHLAQMKE
ncbi:MAG TPA: DUF5753 domain-containing protein [Mycobacteriales bacterium]|nr:DUF5753 domain-containing protein [Mycobacteriales bacterium]